MSYVVYAITHSRLECKAFISFKKEKYCLPASRARAIIRLRITETKYETKQSPSRAKQAIREYINKHNFIDSLRNKLWYQDWMFDMVASDLSKKDAMDMVARLVTEARDSDYMVLNAR